MTDHSVKSAPVGARLRRNALWSIASRIQCTAAEARRDALASSVDALREEVRAALSRAERSSELIGRLEEDNRRLRAREVERRQEPLIRGLITLFDDLRSTTEHEHAMSVDGERFGRRVSEMQVFQRQVLEVLRRNDVETVEPAVAGPFDAERHEVWDVVETDLADRDMCVAEVIRLGFEFAGRVLRPAAVKVYRFHSTVEQGVLQ
jgi:molecular chaperone GrpE (heat shock protein)